MNLKRTVYHIDGRDYESTELITFTFMVQRVSIQNFLNYHFDDSRPGLTIRTFVAAIGEYTIDQHHTNVDRAVKPIIVKCYPETLCKIFFVIGIKDNCHSVDSLTLWVRKTSLRATFFVRNCSYKGIHVFDPKTKKSWLTSGSPLAINGRQAIINGKLWRKYYTSPY